MDGHTHGDQSVRRVHAVIQPAARWPGLNLREIWAYRSLLYFLTWKDLKVRYSQTLLGAGWAVVQPVLAMGIFTVIFGRFARMPSDGVPYAVFALAALVPWIYFSQSLSGSGNSLLVNTNLLTKIYFPRLIIPYAHVLAGLVDFAIAFALLGIVMGVLGRVPPVRAVVLLPFSLSLIVMTAAGVGCWLAALNIQYRDVKHITPFLVQVWLYASPVVYPLSIVPEPYRVVYALNPLASAIEGFRSALLATTTLTALHMTVSTLVAVALFISGAMYFRNTERIFADVA